MKTESYVIRKERCPECAKLGKDKSGDNLAVYSDNHTFCFSCGFSTNSKFDFLYSTRTLVRDNRTISLPYDSSYDYPKIALDWIEQYELNRTDLLKHRVMWSEYYSRLIFPVFDSTGLLAYQGRYFGKEYKPKWWGQGDLKNIYHVLKGGQDTTVIIVEDIVSAIKLQKCGHTAMPLFGSHIGLNRFKRIKLLADRVCIWLDPDKRTETILETNRGSLCGLDVGAVFADKDPKEHSCLEIKEYLSVFTN